MIRFNILTLFPEMFAPLSESIMGRAEAGNAVSFNVVNIRGFSRDKHHKTDDYSFGGGQGMIFMPDPAFRALFSAFMRRSLTSVRLESPDVLLHLTVSGLVYRGANVHHIVGAGCGLARGCSRQGGTASPKASSSLG